MKASRSADLHCHRSGGASDSPPARSVARPRPLFLTKPSFPRRPLGPLYTCKSRFQNAKKNVHRWKATLQRAQVQSRKEQGLGASAAREDGQARHHIRLCGANNRVEEAISRSTEATRCAHSPPPSRSRPLSCLARAGDWPAGEVLAAHHPHRLPAPQQMILTSACVGRACSDDKAQLRGAITRLGVRWAASPPVFGVVSSVGLKYGERRRRRRSLVRARCASPTLRPLCL